MRTVSREVEISPGLKIGGRNPLFLIAGPCVIESEEHTLRMGREIQKICRDLKMPFIFKASFDKANRSSISSYRGPGFARGLDILRRVKQELSIPVLSDVHETGQVRKAAEILDIIQIPALLCRQTDLILEAARAHKPLNLKKGQFLSPQEMGNVLEKAMSEGNENLILTERGTFFGYNNLVFDVRSIPIMKDFGFPVVIDASHSVQRPGGQGASSGGEQQFIPLIAKAGVSSGADGIFLEVHDQPSKALSDKYNSLILNKLKDVLATLQRIRKAVEEDIR